MSEQLRILVVDDEPSVCLALDGVLSRQGYLVKTALNGSEALRYLDNQPVDLALLDLNMKGMNGLELMAEIKHRWPDTVIMILTGYGTLQTALTALRQGAHDYLLKPSSPQDIIVSIEKGLAEKLEEKRRQHLLSRIEADLAELKGGLAIIPSTSDVETKGPVEEMPQVPQVIEAGDVVLDIKKHAFSFEGKLLPLTPIEFKILVSLVQRKGQVVSCSTLVQEAQGHECSEREARILIKAHISHLRQKIRAASPSGELVVNVRGVGYMFVADQD